MPGLKQMPGVGVAYRDYTWSTFARHDNYTQSMFAIALSFVMALPQKRKKSYNMNFKLKTVEGAVMWPLCIKRP